MRVLRLVSFGVFVGAVLLLRSSALGAWPIIDYSCTPTSPPQVFITAGGSCSGQDECSYICQSCFGIEQASVYYCAEDSDEHQVGCYCE
jgi:hypothetical protein